MSNYVINYSTGNITLQPAGPGNVNSNISAGVTFMGQNYANYGQTMNQNWMSIAEHFASNTFGPVEAVKGQLWFDSANVLMKLNTSNTAGAPTWLTVLTSTSSDGNAVFNTVTANYIGNGARLNSINGANVSKVANATYADTSGTVVTAAQPNITSVGTMTALNVNGNVTAQNFIGNIVGNFNVPGANTQVLYNLNGSAGANPFFTFNSDTKTLTVSGGRMVSGVFEGGGGNLSNIQAGNVTGTVASASYAANAGNANTATTAVTASTVTSASQPVITAIGTLGSLNVAGTTITNSLVVNANANISTLNVSANANVNNLRANTVYSNSTLLTLGPVPGGDTTYAVGAVLNYGSGSGPQKGFMGWSDDEQAMIFASNCAVNGDLVSSVTLGNFVINSTQIRGALTTNFITTGGSATVGNITGNWILTSGSRLMATYADLAERYESDRPYEPGTVVELGGDKEITAVKEELSEAVLGVISDTAAYLMNAAAGDDLTHPPVAIAGRVPVKVIGVVKKGDRLVSAGEGIARAARRGEATAFNMIGRSLVDKLDERAGVVLATVAASR
jgi:hypothetical protein